MWESEVRLVSDYTRWWPWGEEKDQGGGVVGSHWSRGRNGKGCVVSRACVPPPPYRIPLAVDATGRGAGGGGGSRFLGAHTHARCAVSRPASYAGGISRASRPPAARHRRRRYPRVSRARRQWPCPRRPPSVLRFSTAYAYTFNHARHTVGVPFRAFGYNRVQGIAPHARAAINPSTQVNCHVENGNVWKLEKIAGIKKWKIKN